MILEAAAHCLRQRCITEAYRTRNRILCNTLDIIHRLSKCSRTRDSLRTTTPRRQKLHTILTCGPGYKTYERAVAGVEGTNKVEESAREAKLEEEGLSPSPTLIGNAHENETKERAAVSVRMDEGRIMGLSEFVSRRMISVCRVEEQLQALYESRFRNEQARSWCVLSSTKFLGR